MQKKIETNHGNIELPAFMPDATYGSIRNTSFKDVRDAGINELVTTTLHLEQKLGSSYIAEYGGLHKFFNWDRPILTDSGGWQVFSLINSGRANPRNKITEVGCSFVDPATGKYSLLTPESSVSIQIKLGADIITVLDDPVDPSIPWNERVRAIELNTKWAARSKRQFDILTKDMESKPLIGAVIQGAENYDLRKQSAEELLDIGFDLYNFGGIPLMEKITWKTESPEGFHREMLAYVSSLIPEDKIKYAMGVGQPDDIAFCVDHGWDLFDTVLPTRNARHGYLYVSEGQGDASKTYKSKSGIDFNHDITHIRTERYKFDNEPVDANCNCECCSTVSRAYLRHLIRIKEPAGFRLATIHNLKFYADWMARLRGMKNEK